MRKKYLTELIGNEFEQWGRRKIIIQAPTGLGKTTFICNTVLPFCMRRKKKLLILCNRRLLRAQYWYFLVQKFSTYGELNAAVEIISYQELAEQLKQGKAAEDLLSEFRVICCDEFHYFYSDSDFNSFGTFALLRALMISGISKLMIFLSATADCVSPYVKEALSQANQYLKIKYPVPSYAFGQRYGSLRDDRLVYSEKKEELEIMMYDYRCLENFDHISCAQVPDWQTICGIVADAKGKSIIFVDDKELAREMAAEIKENNAKGDVALLNADSLDDYENSEIVKQLVMANRLVPKILITTSVLDNGVTVQDNEVENLVIMTESRVSFLQMLGRVRVESILGGLKLWFVRQPSEYYERREKQGMEMKRCIDRIEKELSRNGGARLVQEVWDSGDELAAENIKRFTVFLRGQMDFFDKKFESYSYTSKAHTYLKLNKYAKAKSLDLYRCEAECHAKSRMSDTAVTLMQMRWIGKEESELEVLNSSFLEEKKRKFLLDLKKIQRMTKQELIEAKTDLSQHYRKDFFSDIVAKNCSFSDEKFVTILSRYGLKLKKEKGEDGKERYSVIEALNDGNQEGVGEC